MLISGDLGLLVNQQQRVEEDPVLYVDTGIGKPHIIDLNHDNTYISKSKI